ncbi:2-oxoglutarate dehydrogenase E1 component [gamma proteobacterium IMCC2047]|nr:2-oxoglutarate dehydrogenase E1 component [gamma proteobacterium IMCC2047]
MINDYRAALDEGGHKHFRWQREPDFSMFVDWTPYLNNKWRNTFDTRIGIDRLKALGRAITTVPEGFSLQRQVNKIYTDRQQMIEGEIPVDWGCAEALAYASLLNAGYSVRLTGQDVGRGTFSPAMLPCTRRRTVSVISRCSILMKISPTLIFMIPCCQKWLCWDLSMATPAPIPGRW